MFSFRFAKIVAKIGFPGGFNDFKVQNISGCCDCRFPVRLEGLALAHSAYATYEPELFAGLVYRMTNPKVVAIIFVSGKVLLTGAKYKAHITEALRQVYPLCLEFRKEQTV